MSTINGVIVIDKEKDFTSFDVVAKMRGILKEKKIGHTGTLDPDATGVLPVCVGNATKLVDLLTDKDKEYVAELLLGVTTDTYDTTGQILSRNEVNVNEDLVTQVIKSFEGGYMQVPPMYSAIKVDGKKLYELARAGKEIERAARRVEIPEIEILDMKLPVVKLRIVCSKGTYIRSLCADIGDKLCVGGCMQSLVRTRVGSFRREAAITLSELERLRDENALEQVIVPVDAIFGSCKEIVAKPMFDRLLDNGNPLLPEQTEEGKVYEPGEYVRVYKSDRTFVGIYAYEKRQEKYKPVKMFL